jgi:hypothetical protein
MSKTRVAAASAAAVLAAFAAAGEPSAPAPAAAPYSPGIAEIMIATQIRHAKLWLAGDARNWALADYEVDEIKEGFEDVVEHFPVYKDMPVGKMTETIIMSPIEEVEKAIKAQDRTKFVSAFDKLTEACNSCHQAANRAFIVIQRPSGATFPNQSFAPKRN